MKQVSGSLRGASGDFRGVPGAFRDFQKVLGAYRVLRNTKGISEGLRVFKDSLKWPLGASETFQGDPGGCMTFTGVFHRGLRDLRKISGSLRVILGNLREVQ